MVSNGKAVSCWSKQKRRTGGKTGEEEVEKVEEQQFVGDGGAGLLSGPGLRSSLQRWKKSREGAKRLSRDWATRWRRRCWR